MKFGWKGLGLFLLIIGLIAINTTGIFYFSVNLLDIKIDYLNPPDKPNPASTKFEYPLSGAIVQENGTITTDALFSIQIDTCYNGTLAEGTPFYLRAFGIVFSKGQQAIAGMWIGYHGSSHYSFSGTVDYEPVYQVSLDACDTYGYPVMLQPTFDSSNSLVIKWDAQGDYFPYLRIAYKNGSLNDLEVPVAKVYVNGYNDIQMQNYTRIGTAAAITAVVLGIVDIPTIHSVLSEFRKKNSSSKKAKRYGDRKPAHNPEAKTSKSESHKKALGNKSISKKQRENENCSDDVASDNNQNST